MVTPVQHVITVTLLEVIYGYSWSLAVTPEKMFDVDVGAFSLNRKQSQKRKKQKEEDFEGEENKDECKIIVQWNSFF